MDNTFIHNDTVTNVPVEQAVNTVPDAVDAHLPNVLAQALILALQQPDVVAKLRDAITAPILIGLNQLRIGQIQCLNNSLRVINSTRRRNETFRLLARELPGPSDGPQLGDIPEAALYPPTIYEAALLTSESLQALSAFYGMEFPTPLAFTTFVSDV